MKFIPSLEMKIVFYFVFIIIIIIFKAWKVGKLTQGYLSLPIIFHRDPNQIANKTNALDCFVPTIEKGERLPHSTPIYLLCSA